MQKYIFIMTYANFFTSFFYVLQHVFEIMRIFVAKMLVNMDIELIIDDLIDGLSYRQIALKYNVKLSTLHDFVSKPEHSARAKNALEISAQTYADQAEQILLDIQPDSTPIEMARARELSQYYKWKAAKRNPRALGDKIDVTSDGEKINTSPITILEITQAKKEFDNEL